MKIIILENIRSAYNVGNIIRTADALGWNVWLSGYTPHPDEQIKVLKTSLGAEENVGLRRFDDTLQAIESARDNGCHVFAGEIVNNAKPLNNIGNLYNENVALILGNEVDGVLKSTLKIVDEILYIPMNGVKESMNVGQSAAIFMWELGE